MSTNESRSIPPELLAQLHEALLRAMSNVRDPEAIRLACERMDRRREEIYKKHGLRDIGVPAIRELRGELPELTGPASFGEDERMETTEPAGAIPPEVLAELDEAIRRAMTGVRDPEVMRRACERMDRMREEIYKEHGLLDIGVPAIRELRDE
jgi:hypothetical protein